MYRPKIDPKKQQQIESLKLQVQLQNKATKSPMPKKIDYLQQVKQELKVKPATLKIVEQDSRLPL
jgi:hypothetical protein